MFQPEVGLSELQDQMALTAGDDVGPGEEGKTPLAKKVQAVIVLPANMENALPPVGKDDDDNGEEHVTLDLECNPCLPNENLSEVPATIECGLERVCELAGDGVEDMPQEVAAETVVVTSGIRPRKQSFLDIRKASPVTNPTVFFTPELPSDDILNSQQETTLASNWNNSDAVETTILDGLVVTNMEGGHQAASQQLAHPVSLQTDSSLKDSQKRERDKYKKRQLRQDPNYKAKEREMAKARMRNLRANPNYRETERVRDRVRRKYSRQTDNPLREREKARDRNYRKNRRVKTQAVCFRLQVVDGVVCTPFATVSDTGVDTYSELDTCRDETVFILPNT